MHYFIEITDTFSGEANYSWVTRHKVNDYGDTTRYNSKSGATCAFVEPWEDEIHNFSIVNLSLS